MNIYKVTMTGRVFVYAESAEEALVKVWDDFNYADLGRTCVPTTAVVEEENVND